MNRAFRFEPDASAELENAAVWYNGQRPGLGVEFLAAVDAALEQIARWPEIGRIVPGVTHDVRVRLLAVTRFLYHVAYLDWDGAVRILAVAHDHRRPGSWFSRV